MPNLVAMTTRINHG